jgi:hypothetical protein
MHTRRLFTYVHSFEVSLGIVCALYLALIAGTALALNHAQAMHLDQHSIGRVWLPAGYATDTGYSVPLDLVVRDLNSALLFSSTGARVMDLLAVLWVIALATHLGLRVARRKRKIEVAAKRPANTAMRQPLRKAAPYGESRRAGPAKVLQFTPRR